MIPTNNDFLMLLTLITAYFLGSFPSGYLAGKYISGIDLREMGSGSTGATNVLRYIGKGPAFAVFILDVFKGAASVLLAKYVNQGEFLEVAAGLTSLAGHIWPIWLNWKGGKAVATGLGVLLGISWQVGISSFGIFLLTISCSKIVSLSSIISAVSLPVLMLLSFQGNSFKIAYFALSLLAMILVLWRHRSNFKRILAGQEPKIGQGK